MIRLFVGVSFKVIQKNKTLYIKSMQTLEQLSAQAILAKTRNLQSHLSPTEQLAAQYLLEHADDVVSLSIGSFAEAAGISKSSILRFCESLGFHSYKDFKVALALELGKEEAKTVEAVKATDKAKDIFRKVIHADIRALEESLDLIDEAMLEEAVSLLSKAKRIEIYGVGLSASIAQDAFSRFLRLGFNVAVLTDAHMQTISASLLSEKDAVLAISHSGRSHETLRAAKTAQETGAKVICLSSFLESPLVKLSDVALVSATGETAYRVDALASRIAHLSVIDTLYVSLANKHKKAQAVLEQTRQVMSELTKS